MQHIKGVISKMKTTDITSKSLIKRIHITNADSDRILKTGIMTIANEIVPNFVLSDDMRSIYANLFLYFTGNESRYDLNKGIYLYGEYGVGKTVTMRIFSKFLQRFFNFGPNNFGVTSLEEIAEYYKTNGNLLKFGRDYEEGKLLAFNKCINEFGKPLDEKYYGTNIQNVVNSMLMIRYELFQEKTAVTHATSNYHPGQLNCFDDALLDRFKEMFNFIPVSGDSFR